MKMWEVLAAGFCVILMVGGSALAEKAETVTEKVDVEGAENLQVEIDFGAGDLSIRGEDITEAAILEVFYTPRWVSYDIEYSKKRNTGHLYLESELRRNRYDRKVENEWDLVLSRRYPMELNLDIGACEAELDLGGVPLRELDIDIGAASGTIDFSEPNPERLRELDIEIGASSLEIFNLGNANFESMTFEGGAVSCEMDFYGDLKGESYVELEVGLGSVDIIVPRNLALRVESDDGLFSSVDFHGLKMIEIDDDIYETRDFDQAENRIIFTIEVGMGSVDIYSKR